MLNFSGKVDSNFELVEKGDYEVTLQCEYKKTASGDNTYINCKFQIRSDVEQPFGGRFVFDAIYKARGTDDYNKTKINAILAAIPNAKLDLDDYDDLVQYFNGKNMIISVDIEPANQYHSSDKNVVKYLSYRPSEVGDSAVSATPTQTEEAWEPVDGDLPF